MKLALTSTFRPLVPPKLSPFDQNLASSNMIFRPSVTLTPRMRETVIMMAQKKKPKIEGVSDELNSIASQNLDFAPARRRVRLAFSNVQQQLDHVLFKVYFYLLKNTSLFTVWAIVEVNMVFSLSWILIIVVPFFFLELLKWLLDGSKWDQNRWGK